MEEQGNQWVNAQFMSKFNAQSATTPTDETELHKVKSFLTSKYVDKTWYRAATAAAASAATTTTAATTASNPASSSAKPANVVSSASSKQQLSLDFFTDAAATAPAPVKVLNCITLVCLLFDVMFLSFQSAPASNDFWGSSAPLATPSPAASLTPAPVSSASTTTATAANNTTNADLFGMFAAAPSHSAPASGGAPTACGR